MKVLKILTVAIAAAIVGGTAVAQPLPPPGRGRPIPPEIFRREVAQCITAERRRDYREARRQGRRVRPERVIVRICENSVRRRLAIAPPPPPPYLPPPPPPPPPGMAPPPPPPPQ